MGDKPTRRTRANRMQITLALILCVGLAALMVRSYWTWDCVLLRTGKQIVGIGSCRGIIGFGFNPASPQTRFVQYLNAPAKVVSMPPRSFLGFSCQRAGGTLGIGVPQWLPIGIVVVLLVPLWRRRLPMTADVCRTCGYDLRATPERCPECGSIPAIPSM